MTIVNLSGRKAGTPIAPIVPSGSGSGSGSSPSNASAAAAAAQSSAAARGTSDKSVHDSKCFGLFGWYRRLALIDKALVVAVVFFLGLEAHTQYQKYREAHASDEGGGGSTLSIGGAISWLVTPGSWQARTLLGVIFGTIVGSIAYCCLGCFKRRKARSATSHLRVRGEQAEAVGCCGKAVNFWKSLAMLDKFLVLVLLTFGTADLSMQAKEAGVHHKIQALPSKTMVMLRGTPAPTSAPTPVPPPPPEDPAVVVADMESKVGEAKYAKPPACTEEDFTKIKASGMVGDACRGKPYTQACPTSQLTKIYKPTWIDAEFAKEMVASHTALNDVNTTSTFFGIILGDQYGDDCGKVESTLAPLLSDEAAKADLLKSPNLLCNGVGFMSADLKTKWGVVTSQDKVAITQSNAASGKTLDILVRDAKLSHEIKDYVHVGMATPALMDGTVTFARTRYVTFQHDWQGGWDSVTLTDVVAKMDSAGLSCYWPGDDKLWRITDCWQDFYGYKTYGFVVCVNRNLAPKLHERMEAKFKATIGA